MNTAISNFFRWVLEIKPVSNLARNLGIKKDTKENPEESMLKIAYIV